MATVYIGLGSNLGKSGATLQQAWSALGREPGVVALALSPFYRSAPVGMTSEHLFVNAVGCVETQLSPLQLLDILQRIEFDLGRVRDPESLGYQDRTLDLDMLYYDQECCRTSRLDLPHPRLRERLFVMEPLLDLAPNFCDPETGLPLSRHHQELVAQIALGGCPPQPLERFS